MDCPECRAPLECRELPEGITVDLCPSCCGVFYDRDELAVRLDFADAAPSEWDCPRCDTKLETGAVCGGKIRLDRCPSCGGTWFDAGEIQALRAAAGVDQIAGKPADGASASPRPAPPPKIRKTQEKKSSEAAPPEMARIGSQDAVIDPIVALDGRAYHHFQTSIGVVRRALGEFPWKTSVGDQARLRDFVDPPFILSQEVTDDESVWSKGEYVQPEEVWAAFGLPGRPPAPRGVAPAQPNPWEEKTSSSRRTGAMAAAACVLLFAGFAVSSQNRVVHTESFEFNASDPEKSRVSGVFELGGRTSNVKVRLDTNLDNHWAFLNMALIDADTGRALDFGQEVSWYHGFEDGESWSEGSTGESIFVPSVPPGRYYLRVEPETDAAAFRLAVTVHRDVPLSRILVCALLLLMGPPLWAWQRREVFERQRWMESDHPQRSPGAAWDVLMDAVGDDE